MSAKIILSLSAALALCAGTALAHPHVVSATPAQDAQVSPAPKIVRIKFNEAPTAAFSAIEVKDAAGKPIKTGKAAIDKTDKTILTAAINQPLAPGVYKVAWKAAGSDTHKVDGTYSFTVK
jgi:methionine-rich copper-binding protein CopC